MTPDALKSVYVITQAGAQVPLSAFAHFRSGDDVAGGRPPGAISGRDDLVQSCAGRRSG